MRGCFLHKTDPYFSEKYQESKSYFDEKYTNHFPRSIDSIETSSIRMISDRDSSKNDFSLMLYEYGVSNESVLSVKQKMERIKIASYKSSDTCLLIVNRFETIQTKQSINELPPITDSSKINRECYKGKLPIPNFIDYDNYNKNSALRLDTSFIIYVIESKPVSSWGNQFGMLPSPQMPIGWKNGYSKGVAISQKNNTIIYWLVIW